MLQPHHERAGALEQVTDANFLSPRLLIPSSVDLPPVLYCRGTSPVDAAKSLLHENCLPSPSWDESRLAVIGPTPGIVIMALRSSVSFD